MNKTGPAEKKRTIRFELRRSTIFATKKNKNISLLFYSPILLKLDSGLFQHNEAVVLVDACRGNVWIDYS